MLSSELEGECGVRATTFSVYVALTLLPFVPGAGYGPSAGVASVVVMTVRLFASACVIRGAVSATLLLVALAAA